MSNHNGEDAADPMLDSFDACEVCDERHAPGECEVGIRLSAEPYWFHVAHGLHDQAHHLHHPPLDVCVPLRMVSPDGDLVAAVFGRNETF